MNSGKVCISIRANTVEELFSRVELAKPLADVIEIRFDCLNPIDFDQIIERLKTSNSCGGTHFLATYRPREQGGHGDGTLTRRREFWGREIAGLFWGGDFEEDLIGDPVSRKWKNRICSFHDFSAVAADPLTAFQRLISTDADVLKIAINAGDITDALPVWKLLEKAKIEGRRIIPIAMGEAGKWTRILGPAHGALITYAALDTGGETAPGQITAVEMNDVYRVRELDKTTGIYGVVAGDTSYSLSPFLHNAAFKTARMNSVFIPLQVTDLNGFLRRMVKLDTREIDLNFKGFAVTNPHKQSIMPHLDVIDETARRIGAVNTVMIENGKFHGFNTDAAGFIEPLLNIYGDLSGARVAVIGSGGAARACLHALKQNNVEVAVLARNPERSASLGREFAVEVKKLEISNKSSPYSDFDIIVNTTPVGTRGSLEDQTIATAEQLNGVKLVYDIIYNPAETRLIREASAAGVKTLGGLEMLTAQGVRQFEIWTGLAAPVAEMANAVRDRIGL